MAESKTFQVWSAPKLMAVLIVTVAGATVWMSIPSVEAEGASVSVPLMVVAAFAAALRVIDVRGPLPVALLKTRPPEKTGPSRDTVWEAVVCPSALKMTLFDDPGRPWMTFRPVESEVKLLPLAL